MNRYTYILIVLFFPYSANSQGYLLDSLSEFSQYFHIEGSEIYTTNISYKYNDQHQLILLDYGEGYNTYSYSDTLDVEDAYVHSINRLVRRVNTYHDEDGFKDKKVIENFNEEGEPFVKVVEYYERDENKLVIGIERYELILNALRLASSTEILRDSEGNEYRKVTEHYIYGSDYYDYNYYKDSIESVYLDGTLHEKDSFSFFTTGEMDRCSKKFYTYYDNYFVEDIHLPDDDDCTAFTRYESIYKYYSDEILYEYDSVLVYRETDEGLELHEYKETYFDDINENEAIVFDKGGTASMSVEFENQYFYTMPIVSTVSSINKNLDVIMYPNIVDANGLITIETASNIKLKIEIFDRNGVFLNYRYESKQENRGA